MNRLSVLVSKMVEEAVSELEVPQAVRDGIEWEVMPVAVRMAAGITVVTWLIGIGVKIPGTGDWEFPFGQLSDPHSGDEIRLLVRAMYARAQAEADEGQKRATAPLNGHGNTPGGLIIP